MVDRKASRLVDWKVRHSVRCWAERKAVSMEWKRVAPKVDWKEATTDEPAEDCSAECWVAWKASRTGAQRAATWGPEMAASSVP